MELINDAAAGSDTVQAEIQDISSNATEELQVFTREMNQIEDQYNSVQAHIEEANRLGTTKSGMFENIDNMLSQVEPLLRELE